MRLPRPGEREMFYWMDQKEWHTFDENGMAVFKEGTPQRVLDSYKQFCNRS